MPNYTIPLPNYAVPWIVGSLITVGLVAFTMVLVEVYRRTSGRQRHGNGR